MFLRGVFVNQGVICKCCGSEIAGKLLMVAITEPTEVAWDWRNLSSVELGPYGTCETDQVSLGRIQIIFGDDDPHNQSQLSLAVESPSDLLNAIMARMEIADDEYTTDWVETVMMFPTWDLIESNRTLERWTPEAPHE